MYRITLRRTTAVELCTAAALGIGLAGQARAAEPAGDAWRFEVTPYIFGAGLRGTTGVGQVRADIDSSFGDILKHFDSGLMGRRGGAQGARGARVT